MHALHSLAAPPAGASRQPRARGILLRLGLTQSAALSVHTAYARAAYNNTLANLDTILSTHNQADLSNPTVLTRLFTQWVDQDRAGAGRLAGGHRPVEVAAVTELAHTIALTGTQPAPRAAQRGEHVLIPDRNLRPADRSPWVSAILPDVGTIAFRWGPRDPDAPTWDTIPCSLRFARFGSSRWYVYVLGEPASRPASSRRFRDPLRAAWSSRPGHVAVEGASA